MCSSASAFLLAVPVTCCEGTFLSPGARWQFTVRNASMITRKFGGIGVVALSLAVAGLVAFVQQGRTAEKGDHKDNPEAMQACAKACSVCQRACDGCATHCSQQLAEGKKGHLTTLACCQDCATCCAAAAQICSRGGPCCAMICECCTKACNHCATACEKFPDDKHMKLCAEECRKCEMACKEMVKQLASR